MGYSRRNDSGEGDGGSEGGTETAWQGPEDGEAEIVGDGVMG